MEKIFSPIKERIFLYLENKGIKKSDFFDQTGISPSNFKGLGAKSEIGGDKLVKILTEYPDINPTWLLLGKGNSTVIINEQSETYQANSTSAPEIPTTICKPNIVEKKYLPEINYDHKGAPYYNVDFIGGFDLVLNDQTRNPDYYINFPPYNKEGVIWCNITGHSMEPELNNGDFIAMKEMYSPIEYLPVGEIYGIVTDDYRTVKRIRMSKRKGFIRLIPTNKSPEYGEQEIPVSMIRKIYAVLGSMHRLF